MNPLESSINPNKELFISPLAFQPSLSQTYRRISDDWYIDKNTNYASRINMNFSEALVQLKKGVSVKRKSWQSSLRLGEQEIPVLLYNTLTKEQKDLLYNFIKDSKPYALTKEDILAEDWEIKFPT